MLAKYDGVFSPSCLWSDLCVNVGSSIAGNLGILLGALSSYSPVSNGSGTVPPACTISCESSRDREGRTKSVPGAPLDLT